MLSKIFTHGPFGISTASISFTGMPCTSARTAKKTWAMMAPGRRLGNSAASRGMGFGMVWVCFAFSFCMCFLDGLGLFCFLFLYVFRLFLGGFSGFGVRLAWFGVWV